MIEKGATKSECVPEEERMGDANFVKACIPIFDGDYDHWSLLMENLMRSKEYWKVMKEGFT